MQIKNFKQKLSKASNIKGKSEQNHHEKATDLKLWVKNFIIIVSIGLIAVGISIVNKNHNMENTSPRSMQADKKFLMAIHKNRDQLDLSIVKILFEGISDLSQDDPTFLAEMRHEMVKVYCNALLDSNTNKECLKNIASIIDKIDISPSYTTLPKAEKILFEGILIDLKENPIASAKINRLADLIGNKYKELDKYETKSKKIILIGVFGSVASIASLIITFPPLRALFYIICRKFF